MAQAKSKIDKDKVKNTARKYVSVYRVQGGYRFADRGGLLAVVNVRDDVPDHINAQFAEIVQLALYQYGKVTHLYK